MNNILYFITTVTPVYMDEHDLRATSAHSKQEMSMDQTYIFNQYVNIVSHQVVTL